MCFSDNHLAIAHAISQPLRIATHLQSFPKMRQDTNTHSDTILPKGIDRCENPDEVSSRQWSRASNARLPDTPHLTHDHIHGTRECIRNTVENALTCTHLVHFGTHASQADEATSN